MSAGQASSNTFPQSSIGPVSLAVALAAPALPVAALPVAALAFPVALEADPPSDGITALGRSDCEGEVVGDAVVPGPRPGAPSSSAQPARATTQHAPIVTTPAVTMGNFMPQLCQPTGRAARNAPLPDQSCRSRLVTLRRPGPRSSGDRAVASGAMRAGSNPAGGTL